MTAAWFPSSLPRETWLRNAQIPAAHLDVPQGPVDKAGLVRADLRIAHGVIAAIAPAGSATDGPDLDRGQLWPCFVDGHVHLDKTQTWPRQQNPDGTHSGAKAAVIADRGKYYSDRAMNSCFRGWTRPAFVDSLRHVWIQEPLSWLHLSSRRPSGHV